MKTHTLLLSLCLINMSFPAYGSSDTCSSFELKSAKQLNRVYQKDEFYIFYSDKQKSRDRIQNLNDTNNNAIPDYIEDIAIQAVASRDIFKLAGFRHPLKSPRYKNVKAIAIYVHELKGNGLAYENSSRAPSATNLKNNLCFISISISNQLKDFPGNYWTTITHELFHLYQYSYAQFKNAWYLESMANWAERALRRDITPQTTQLRALPQNALQVNEQFFNKNYNHMWRRLFFKQQKDAFLVPDELLKRTYIDGSLVFKDNVWYGTKFAKHFLTDLENSSIKISNEKKWNPYQWKESDQKLKQWNCTIFKTYQNNLKEFDKKDNEIKSLNEISSKSINDFCS